MASIFTDLSERASDLLDLVGGVVDVRALWEQFFTREAGTIALFHWKNVIIYVVPGLLFFAWTARGTGYSLRDAFRSLVPPKLESKAVRVDLQFFLYDLLGLRQIMLVGVSVMLGVPVFSRLVRGLELWKLPGLSAISAWATHLDPLPQGALAFTLATLGSEFLFYWYHRAAHHFPVLWQFHKVHHYSQEMNPMVAVRVHDLDEALHMQTMFLGSLLFLGLVFPIGDGSIDWEKSTFWAVLLYQMVLKVSGRFAHSHIPISYGPVLDRIINTAVVHQMHHSRDIYNTNFGQSLSIWDTVFGTLRLPAPGEKINFGITEFGDDHYRSLPHALIEPYVDVVKLLRAKVARWRGTELPHADPPRAKPEG
jgi:sterol desaturase/sphingolipid hydroxylase (fatty acid hydroxylase superfamily)